MTVDERYQRLEDTVRAYNPTASFDKIRAAYEFAAAAHQGQLRKDGSPFVTHPLAVAQIVAEELHLDSESIEAALLHDTIEDTAATHEDIAKQFSPTVADLVEGVSKLTRVHYTSKAQEQMENLRKMLLAMSKDIRVILIKVSDRLHNMRTMEYQTPEKQKQKSFETLEIYAPIAHRLGMQKMKWELEDLSLKYPGPHQLPGDRGRPGREGHGVRRLHVFHPRPDHPAPGGGPYRRLCLWPHEAPLLHLSQDVHPEQVPGRRV